MVLHGGQTEVLLNDISNEEALRNAHILDNVWFFAIGISVFFICMIILANFVLKNHRFALGIVIILLMAILALGLFYAYKTEIDTGYYRCQSCDHKFVPDYGEAMFRAKFHIPKYAVRHLECPVCGEETWAEKVLSK